jgi:Pyruvate/2-oxoacid:ferredoxin oxidoreductase delta subunit
MSEIQYGDLMKENASSELKQLDPTSETKPVDAGTPYQYDPNFHGVEEGRKCTDVCMTVIFVLFICCLLAIFFVALPRSNVKYLYIPTDHRGMMCGYDNSKIHLYTDETTLPDNNSTNTTNTTSITLLGDAPEDPAGRGPFLDLRGKPYLFWVRPGKKGYSRSFCVEKCPNEGLFTDAFLAMFNHPYGFDSPEEKCGNSTHATLENYSNPHHYYCPYNTSLFAQRCFPTLAAFNNSFDDLKDNISEALKSVSTLSNAFEDLTLTWKYIVFCVLIALFLSLLWLVLLRFTAAFMVWFSIILALGGLVFLTYMAYQYRNNVKASTKTEAQTFGLISKDLNKKIWTAFFVILVVLDVIFFLLIIFLFKRIRLSIGLIKCVSHIFGKVPQLFFFPLVIYIAEFIWWAYVIGVAVVLFGAGKPYDSYDHEYSVHKIDYNYDGLIQGFSIVHFIGFLWVTWFISAVGQTTIAGVIADYYFTTEPKKDNLRKNIVLSSLGRTLRYHVGSLALGSLILTIMTILRMMIEYIDQKTKQSQSSVAKFAIKCLKCCLYCLDKFLKYLTRNVYIMIAIHGYNFWNGCKQAFNLLLRNAVRAATVNFVGDFTLFIGKVFVCGAVTGVALVFFQYCVEGINYAIIPALIVFIMSYFASGAFSSVFEMGIDSMFLCFLEDEERNDGTPGHEKYAPQELVDYFNK